MFILFMFLPMFMLKMYSQNVETCILEFLENEIFFAAQPWWEDFYRIHKKFSLWILQFSGGISVSFLKNLKKSNL